MASYYHEDEDAGMFGEFRGTVIDSVKRLLTMGSLRTAGYLIHLTVERPDGRIVEWEMFVKSQSTAMHYLPSMLTKSPLWKLEAGEICQLHGRGEYVKVLAVA